MRLSHVVLDSPEPESAVAFYENHLGFRLSDTTTRIWAVFSTGIPRGPHAALHHLSFEMRGIDEYMYGTGRLMRHGWTKLWGPGWHRAGDNAFSYFRDPSGNTMEYTTELVTLDEDTWHATCTTPASRIPRISGAPRTRTSTGHQGDVQRPDKGRIIAPPV